MSQRFFEERIGQHAGSFAPVVPVAAADRLLQLDFTAANTELTEAILKNTAQFDEWVKAKLAGAGARYGIGGYGEHRTIYSRSELFSPSPAAGAAGEAGTKAPSWEGSEMGIIGGQGAEPRRFHLGTDIWGPAYTPVFAPLDGVVHSLAFNDHFGDYGATLIVEHRLEDLLFYSLYGHLSLSSINGKQEGQAIAAGERIAFFGEPHENGHWPPHLHFQLMLDMEGMKGDYPGVCRFSERTQYLANCPDPELILGLNLQTIKA